MRVSYRVSKDLESAAAERGRLVAFLRQEFFLAKAHARENAAGNCKPAARFAELEGNPAYDAG